MEYIIVHYSSTNSLATAVNEKIAEGWEPSGGVCGFYTAAGYFYLQAMTRTAKKY